MNRSLAFSGVGVIGCVCLALLPWLFLTSHAGEVTVENRADESIEHVTVMVSSQALEFSQISTGEKRTEKYKIGGADSQYDISVTFRSGRKIDARLGYVTNGMDFRDTLIVTNDQIIYESGLIQ